MGQPNPPDAPAGDAGLIGAIAASQVQVRQLRTELVARDRDARDNARLRREAEHATGLAGQRLDEEMRRHQAALTALMQAQGELHAIRSSTSWRALAPVRALGRRAPGLARLVGRAAKLGWWIVTLQLVRRLRSPPPGAAVPPLVPPADEPPGAAVAAEPLRLPVSDRPVVSVVICTYGQEALTLACLRSIEAAPPDHPIEVILLDDAAPSSEAGRSLAALAHAAGARVLRNDDNLGFLRSSNKAAGLARGDYLHFLNNDTELRPGALDALADLLDARADAGLVGSKLIYPDGRLQEAGGIVWRDATGMNVGRGLDPLRPEFNYVRQADYCSGASLMIRRTLFEALGGFDDVFAPAYYEDTDLAFRVRAQGSKVYYEPRSVVVHHEGASHGTDIEVGGKAHQAVNRQVMLQRWGATLDAEQYDSGTHLLRARDRARHRTVALVIDHYALEPDRDGGSRALTGMIQGLLDAGWVVKYWPYNQQYQPVYSGQLEAIGVEVIDQRRAEPFADWMRREGGELDHVIVGRPEIAAEMMAPLLRSTRARLSFFGHDVHFLRMRQQASVTGDAALLAQADAMERLERRLWPMFDTVLYLSEQEAELVRQLAPGVDVRSIVQFCFDTQADRTAAPSSDTPRGRSLLFVAGFAHPPNVDAALYLVREIVPAVEALVGPVHVVLAGSSPSAEVLALAGERVEVTGFITDVELAALYRTCRVAAVPLRFGAGVKGKVVEALSQGLPLVTTPIGVQGLEAVAAVVRVGDDLAALAADIAHLLTEDGAWLAQSHAQSALARERFSLAAMRRSIVDALTPVA